MSSAKGITGAAALVAVLFIFHGVSPAHMDPFVTFICSFTDNQGNEVNNFYVYLQTEGPGGHSEIVDGEARVIIGFRENFTGTVRLRVLDKRRKEVGIITPSGERVTELAFNFSHVLGSRMLTNSNPDNFLDDGIEYVSADGRIVPEQNSILAFTIDWNPGMMSEVEREEVALHRLIDQQNMEEFRKKLAEVKRKRKTDLRP